jgi:hypothetical protein
VTGGSWGVRGESIAFVFLQEDGIAIIDTASISRLKMVFIFIFLILKNKTVSMLLCTSEIPCKAEIFKMYCP